MEDKHSWNKPLLPSFKNLQAERQRKRHKTIWKMPQIPPTPVTARPRTRSDSFGKEWTHMTPHDSLSEESRARKRKNSPQNVDHDDTTPRRNSKEKRDSVKLPCITFSEGLRRSFEIRHLWVKAFRLIRNANRFAKYIQKRREIKIRRSVKVRKSILQAALSNKVRNLWVKAFHILRNAHIVTKEMASRSLEIELSLKTFTDFVFQDDQIDKKIEPSNQNVGNIVKEATLSLRAQSIMLLPPSSRTAEDCSVVMCNLQFFESFRLYPLDIQRNIVRRGHFLALPPGRILTREGHIAQNWYFVVSGQGVVRKIVQREVPYKMTVDILTTGMTFGESEFEQNTRRSCTVMSRKTLHLISLSKVDYLFIFSKRIKTNSNEHLDFLRNIHFMKYWPIERLLNRSFLCYQAYFRNNDVVVENSREANTICIIRSGQCVLNMYVEATKASLADTQLTPSSVIKTEWKTEITRNKWKKESRNKKEEEMKHKDNKQIKKETKVNREEKATKEMGMKQERSREKGWRPRQNKTSSLPSPKRCNSYTVNSGPVYLEIKTLSAGDVFGLENIKIPGIKEEICNSRFCLVSLGAEVILLSKRFYLAHWNVNCQQQVFVNKPSYPKMEAVHTHYRRHLAWDLYVKKVRDELFEDFSNEGRTLHGVFFDTRYVFSPLQV